MAPAISSPDGVLPNEVAYCDAPVLHQPNLEFRAIGNNVDAVPIALQKKTTGGTLLWSMGPGGFASSMLDPMSGEVEIAGHTHDDRPFDLDSFDFLPVEALKQIHKPGPALGLHTSPLRLL